MISGSDDWSGGWAAVKEHPGVYRKPWPYQWGMAENKWYERFGTVIEGPGARREMVFIDGVRMTQKLIEAYKWTDPDGREHAKTDPDGKAGLNTPGFWEYAGYNGPGVLVPGTYGVTEKEEHGRWLYVYPPKGVDLNDALVEVATRGRLLNINMRENVVLRNLTFTHGSNFPGNSAVGLQANNALYENLTVTNNNSYGLSFGYQTRGVTVRNSVFNENGTGGLSASRLDNVIIIDCDSSFNNWRGHLGNLHGSITSGTKIMGPDGDIGVRVINHRSIGNLTHGFWFDHGYIENGRISFERCRFVANKFGSQLYLEKQMGPISVTDCMIWNQGGGTAIQGIADRVTIADSAIVSLDGTNHAMIHLAMRGSSNRYSNDWTLKRNLLVTNRKQPFFHTFWLTPEMRQAITTFASSGNSWNQLGNNPSPFFNSDTAKATPDEWRSIAPRDRYTKQAGYIEPDAMQIRRKGRWPSLVLTRKETQQLERWFALFDLQLK